MALCFSMLPSSLSLLYPSLIIQSSNFSLVFPFLFYLPSITSLYEMWPFYFRTLMSRTSFWKVVSFLTFSSDLYFVVLVYFFTESTPNGRLNAGSEPFVICGNKTQALSFSCVVGYRGKIGPILHWQQLLRGNVINYTNVTSFTSTESVVSNLSVEVNYNTIESSYICKTKLSQFGWTSDKLNIQCTSTVLLLVS